MPIDTEKELAPIEAAKLYPVTPLSNASQRTKNRFREHDLFSMSDEPVYVRVLGSSGILTRCRTHCDWAGWLPFGEIELNRDTPLDPF